MGRWRWVGVIVAVVVVALAAYFLSPVRGPARNLSLTGDAVRGAYLIKVGGCAACHTDTANKGAPLAGGAPIVTPFGSFIPPNITSDPKAGIGDWTLAEFADALSNGHGPNGPLYPVFPYTSYTLMTDQDLVDLFAAIKKIAPVSTPAPAHKVGFPFNIRLVNRVWQHLFFKPHRFVPDPNHSALWNRGAYIANGLGHCVACHSPRNALGAIEWDKAFTGSPKGAVGGHAPPLTPAELTRGLYDEAGLEDTLKTGVSSGGDNLSGDMALVVADSTSQWTDADRHAVAAYLLGLDK